MATRKPGFQDTTTNRNKRESRYTPAANNDTSYRLGTADAPTEASEDNKNRNRFS